MMILWIEWWDLVKQLRSGFSRTSTFLWFVTAMAGFSIRSDRLGVTSLVRALGLKPSMYDRLRQNFHSSAVKLDRLAQSWFQVILKNFPNLIRINGRLVLVGDGIKVGKEGKKMPAVKLLHQQSQSNTKPEYIMGHSAQAVSILAGTFKHSFAVPIVSRIHEGLKFSNRDQRSLLDKMISMVESLLIQTPFYLVVDAYYASGPFIRELVKNNQHIISRARSNAVAFMPVATMTKNRKRGRPKKYGKKIRLSHLFKGLQSFSAMRSPVYGEQDVSLKFLTIDLIWKSLGEKVRFVLVDHPNRGRIILMTSDLTLEARDIIIAYGLRFKIEVSFKQALEGVGAYAYHFWMQSMKPIKRRSGNQHLHRESERYRMAVKVKMNAFHTYIQAALIAQGALQYLSLTKSVQVWLSFGSWLRTIRADVLPSEMVTAKALQNSISEFLIGSRKDQILAKFIRKRIDISRAEGLRLIA